ncbi:ribose-5-phosphate isomerase [Piptocephalis cylindrospora]|uniref:Ribose-5-phosphate isomerase n=1 Tax=Piptocephalis cylindrospora TaxID=1907219 RepID=A0A4P9Y1S4_9FUNG|nr:ribose-5-phosphate isomerase [Piptocephalis cylindrospora]|eukprot:RKP12788.1 ribose-5-phosphate isomerase [Piptocephalis cylindrospora]
MEKAKKDSAYRAGAKHITPETRVLGVGSGSTIVYLVHYLRENREKLHPDLVCIPTGFQSRQLLVENGFRVAELDEFPVIDVAIDGADEVDASLNVIKGGGAAHLREKVVASAAKDFIIIADYRKMSEQLGQQWKQGVPIEVIPFALSPVMARLKEMGGAPTLRMAQRKAGPVVTDNGNFVVDVDFGLIADPASLLARTKALAGVVEVGLFCSMARIAYFGMADGSVQIREA